MLLTPALRLLITTALGRDVGRTPGKTAHRKVVELTTPFLDEGAECPGPSISPGKPPEFSLTLSFFNFFFYIDYNVVLVLGVPQSDSVILIHIYVPIPFQILFPFRLLHNIEQSSLCYMVGSCWLSI